eukprot:2794336-Amphidinium_carterae.1
MTYFCNFDLYYKCVPGGYPGAHYLPPGANLVFVQGVVPMLPLSTSASPETCQVHGDSPRSCKRDHSIYYVHAARCDYAVESWQLTSTWLDLAADDKPTMWTVLLQPSLQVVPHWCQEVIEGIDIRRLLWLWLARMTTVGSLDIPPATATVERS